MSILVLEHSDIAGSARLGRALRDFGHRLDVRRLHRGDSVPSDVDGVDGVIAFGGSFSANDASQPWLEPEMALLRTAHEGGLPVVGICLGCQLLARALGGTVRTLDEGIELGWHTVSLTPAGRENPVFAGVGWQTMQPHWHREEIAELPGGAHHLASSERCRVQAWSAGLRTFGFQYHPEIDEDALDRWADDEPAALEEAGLTRTQLVEQTARHMPACNRLGDRVFESLALCVMPVDRRYAGVAKDLHH